MEICRARAMGWCFGVRDAVVEAMSQSDPGEVTIFGELVHNRDVISQLEQRGLLQFSEGEREALPRTTSVLVTAHGVSQRTYQRFAQAGLNVIDTTCPLVRRVHAAAMQLDAEQRHVVVVGQPGHVEVRGIVEDLANATVWPNPEAVIPLPAQRIGVIAQSTTRPDVAAATLARIRELHPGADISWVDTICQPTRDRQSAVDELLQEVSVLVVVGGANSNNSRALAERAVAQNVRAHLVQSAGEVRTEWFQAHDVVGLTAGTSTPDEAIEAVAAQLESIRERFLTNRIPTTSWEWVAHFEARFGTRPVLDWQQGLVLSERERSAVAGSIAIFQRGETGTGAHLLQVAQAHALEVDDSAYVSALELFIREENEHARLLGEYLDAISAPRLKQTWTDRWFRWLRHLAGLELSITVLVTAEVIAMAYYAALRRATRCTLLRALCRQILEDEVYHLHFQGQRLGRLRSRWSRLRAVLHAAIHRGFQEGVWVLVWFSHYSVFRQAGWTFCLGRRRCLKSFRYLMAIASSTTAKSSMPTARATWVARISGHS